MGRKRTRTGKYIYFCIAGLILLSFASCTISEKTNVKIIGEEKSYPYPLYGKETSVQADDKDTPKENPPILALPTQHPPEEKTYQYLRRSKELLAQGDYEGALKENQRALALSAQKPPEDEALFHMGLIHVHSGNAKRDYGKSLHFLRKLVKDFPQSSFAETAKILMGILQENEKLKQSIDNLNQMIEKSKQVDIEIEEKKKEKRK